MLSDFVIFALGRLCFDISLFLHMLVFRHSISCIYDNGFEQKNALLFMNFFHFSKNPALVWGNIASD